MSFVYNLLVILHFLGLASLIGGFLVQIKSSPRVVNPAMLHGALTVGDRRAAGGSALPAARVRRLELPTTPRSAKFVVLLVVLRLILANRKKDQISTAVGFDRWAVDRQRGDRGFSGSP